LSLAAAVVLVPRGRTRAGGILASVPALVGAVTIYAHAYAAREIYRAGAYTSVGLLTAVMIVLLGLAVLLTVPHGALQWLSFGTDPGAALLRLIVPIALFLVPFVGWLRVKGQSEGLFDTEVGSALLMTIV